MRLLSTLIVLALVIGCSSSGPQSPNIVIFLADDLGWADVGYRGSRIETPAIDRLAREGMRLERFYVMPICSPTRAALVTGRDPMTLGIAYDQIHPWYNAGLPPDTVSLAETFRRAGYQTALVGKWHLGHTQEHQLPKAHGFEQFHGHLHTNTDFYTHEREGGHDLQHNGRSVYAKGKYLTHVQRDDALRFLRTRDEDRPFLLYMPFTAPHSPMQAPEETIALYSDLPQERNRRTYAAMVHELDAAMGAVLHELDEQGLADDTIVLFFSDNGGSTIFGGNNQPLRGEKGTTFEGGIRVPAVLRWPKGIEAGSERVDVVSVLDLLPTLASATDVPTDSEAPLDGRNLWPALVSGEPTPVEEPLYFASEIPLPGLIHLAVIDRDWKLVQIVREGQTETQVRTSLFRIREDPNEEADVSAQYPEVVERLAGQIRAWRSRHPMAGTRGTLVPHPGWVPPKEWAQAVQPAGLLQERWNNELPFGKALLDATAERGVLVDDAERERLLEAEREWKRSVDR